MNNSTSSPLRKSKIESIEEKKLVIEINVSHTKIPIIPQFDKNSPTALSDKNAVDLFSSFTANIIKEETLFTR